MPERAEVYKIIDSEREYQGDLGPDRTDSSDHSVGDYLVMLDTYLRAAKDEWTNNAGVVMSLHNVRKVAAIAVRCMEEHGAPSRALEQAEKKV
jgi:hypothetical protein